MLGRDEFLEGIRLVGAGVIPSRELVRQLRPPRDLRFEGGTIEEILFDHPGCAFSTSASA